MRRWWRSRRRTEEVDRCDEEAEKDSESVKAAKQRKRNDKTKDLVAKSADCWIGQWEMDSLAKGL